MTIDEVMEHLKASNGDHVRCVLETDENMILLDHVERLQSDSEQLRQQAEAVKETAKGSKSK